MEYRDAVLILTILGIIIGSTLTILGIWEIKKQRKKSSL